MATIYEDLFGGSGNPIGRTPDTVDNGNTYTQLGDDATFNVQSGYCGITGFGTGTFAQQNRNLLVLDCGHPNVLITCVAWDKNSSGSSEGVGACFRASDQENCLTAKISRIADTFELVKCDSGTETTLDSASVTIATETEYTLVVTANGDDITAELYDSGANLLSTLTATDSFNNTVENHGVIYGRANSVGQRIMSIKVEEAATLGAEIDSNGYDIVCNGTNTTTSNYGVKINGGGAIEPEGVVRRSDGATVRLRLPNANCILSTDTVTVTDTAGGFTDEAATNNSVQESDKIVLPLPGGGTYALNFSAAVTRGITKAGVIAPTSGQTISSVTYTRGSGEEQFRGDVQINPGLGDDAFGDAALSLPYTLQPDDGIVCRVHLPTIDTHATSTLFEVGDVIRESGVYYRCTTGGTTAGTKPTFPSNEATVNDGTVVWQGLFRLGYEVQVGQTVLKASHIVCAGASLKSQSVFAPAPYAGSDKTWIDSSNVNASVLPGDTISNATSVADAEAIVSELWYDLDNTDPSAASIPAYSYPGYGQNINQEWSKVVQAVCGTGLYKDVLIDRIVQRGIEQRAIREIGGDWEGNGGWSQGRLAMALLTGALLEDSEAWIAALKTNANTTFDWGGTEFGTQVFYVEQADIDRVLDSAFEYNPSSLDTYVNPSTAPTTYSDSPSNAYFPASVRGSWLNSPEWGLRHENEPDRDTPLWNYNDVETYYRRCCTAAWWGFLCYLCDALDITETVDAPAFFDYVRRYEHIQGPSGVDANWSDEVLWTLFETNEPAFAFTAAAVIVGGTWYIDLNFNRYATATDANILSQFACSGSVTLSNADQTGPRTFRVQASADPRGETITYTESGTAANRVVDAGNNELPTGITATVIGTQELQLTINPTTAPSIVASGGKLNFGTVANGTLAARSIEIENIGNATLKLDLNTATITSTDIVNYFAKGSGSWNDDEDVAPDGTLQLAVTFNAAAATLSPGTYTAVLSIPSNDANSPFTLNLSATVVEVGPSTKGNWGINTAIKIGV